MSWRRLYKRIKNLDRLYMLEEQFRMAAYLERDPEARAGLNKLADKFRRKYQRMVEDRRLVNA